MVLWRFLVGPEGFLRVGCLRLETRGVPWGSFEGPVGSWRIPLGPLGWSSGVPARLPAPATCFWGFLGVPWDGPWGSPLVRIHREKVLWFPFRTPWKLLGGPGSFLGVPCGVPWMFPLVWPFGVPWGSRLGGSLGPLGPGLPWGPLGWSLGIPARLGWSLGVPARLAARDVRRGLAQGVCVFRLAALFWSSSLSFGCTKRAFSCSRYGGGVSCQRFAMTPSGTVRPLFDLQPNPSSTESLLRRTRNLGGRG